MITDDGAPTVSQPHPAAASAPEKQTRPNSYRRGMLLVTGASMLSPLVGLVTAPLIAHSLGAAGRGAATATSAPNLFILGVSTLGLNEAVAYLVARNSALTRRATAVASTLILPVGAVCAGVVWLLAPTLSAGDTSIVGLMRLCGILAVPGLMVGVVRGTAVGRQLWNLTALDRALGSTLKLISVVMLAVIHHLTVSAVAITWVLTPMITAVVFVRALATPTPGESEVPPTSRRELARDLLSFGSRQWLGDIATMMTARLPGLIVAPLSNLTQLGFLVVGTTIADVPYMLTTSVREVAFGANSAERRDDRLLSTSRVMLIVTLATCVPLAGTLPWWIVPAFGHEFRDAVLPTWILLLSTAVAIPGLIAGAGLSSVAKPHLRSLALFAGLVTYAVGLLLLVPTLGATGAAISGLASSLVTSTGCMWASTSSLGVKARDYVAPRRADIALLHTTLSTALRPLRIGR